MSWVLKTCNMIISDIMYIRNHIQDLRHSKVESVAHVIDFRIQLYELKWTPCMRATDETVSLCMRAATYKNCGYCI